MKTYIALFRGINVGGKNLISMKGLEQLLEELRLSNIKTYIQSGNAVFQCANQDPPALIKKIVGRVEIGYGFKPELIILGTNDLTKIMTSNPFPEAVSEPSKLHVMFLSSVPKSPDLKSLEGIKRKSERFSLLGSVFYLHAPDGIGRSKLANRVEKSLGVSGTSRNWRTVTKLKEMVD